MSLQHRLRYHDFRHFTHRRLPPSLLDVLQPLSLEIEGRSVFKCSEFYLQVLSYLYPGQSEVDLAGSAITCRQSILLDHG